tara:strand:+ start:1588 stop:2316 length:729 start_codon:yes stop_codon:yes gene_type:complete
MNMMTLKITLLVLVFLLGVYTYSCNFITKIDEPFTVREDCPNVLIQKGGTLYLKNTKKAEVPGVNPVKFDNLEEYVEYMKWQQAKGIKCPILYLQHTYNTQGTSEYRVRPGPLTLEGGLEQENDMNINISGREITERASIENAMDNMLLDRLSVQPHNVEESLMYDSHRDDKPFNTNQYPGIDLENQYIGLEVPLDQVYRHHKTKEKSPNAMDTNWGGIKYSRKVVASGIFDENTRKMNEVN